MSLPGNFKASAEAFGVTLGKDSVAVKVLTDFLKTAGLFNKLWSIKPTLVINIVQLLCDGVVIKKKQDGLFFNTYFPEIRDCYSKLVMIPHTKENQFNKEF